MTERVGGRRIFALHRTGARMSAAVVVEGLVKRFRAGIAGCCAAVEALRGIDLEIGARELVGITGPPGAGKTTLLLCLAGLLRPDEGRIVWFGRRRAPHTPPPGIAFAPEHAIHYSFLTVRESLEYYATLQDVPGARLRIDEAIARSALRVHARCRVSMLDRALRQRLGIARALLVQPRLLILDAPLAGLDGDARRTITELLRELRDSGVTIVASAREAWELTETASRVVTLVSGRLRSDSALPSAGGTAGAGRAVLPQPFAGGGLVAEHLS